MDKSLDQRVFEKMGWEYKLLQHPNVPGDLGYGWVLSAGQFFTKLPPISSSWEVCAKFLVGFMRQKGYIFRIQLNTKNSYMLTYNLEKQDDWIMGPKDTMLNITEENPDWWEIETEIKDDNIAFAACEAFMEVKL